MSDTNPGGVRPCRYCERPIDSSSESCPLCGLPAPFPEDTFPAIGSEALRAASSMRPDALDASRDPDTVEWAEPPLRPCRHCGRHGRTTHENCPHCGGVRPYENEARSFEDTIDSDADLRAAQTVYGPPEIFDTIREDDDPRMAATIYGPPAYLETETVTERTETEPSVDDRNREWLRDPRRRRIVLVILIVAVAVAAALTLVLV